MSAAWACQDRGQSCRSGQACLLQPLCVLQLEVERALGAATGVGHVARGLLNACHHFPSFVYAAARLIEATNMIEVDVRARRGSRPHCSCCGEAAPGYDLLAIRRFEFIPIWGYAVMLLYAPPRPAGCRWNRTTTRCRPTWPASA